MKTDISIIAPAYNPGELLLETYNSLEKQTFQNFEWIIVDDNSNEYNQKLIEHIIRNSTNIRQLSKEIK
jgi:glycosyltransferase involved in cell wall biosynthesis